ncbi:MAG: putative tributyrin esterase [Frankiales bacterium]|nr:putative tributyrin esterase [Frankiales bacterium]
MSVEVVDFFSVANARRFPVWTWTPPGDGPFPLLLLLHGVYDSGGHGWWLRARAPEAVQALGLDRPPILIMPSDTGAEQGSGYCDWVDGTTKAETFLLHELLPWAAGALPVSDERWVTGLSMGGYGAFTLALRRPGTFSSATATSPFFNPDRLFGYVPHAASRMWGDDEGMQAHDPRRLIGDPARRGQTRFALDCGTDDGLIDQSRAMHAQLSDLGVEHGYAEHPGAHDWGYWAAHVADHVAFHAQVPGPLTLGVSA